MANRTVKRRLNRTAATDPGRKHTSCNLQDSASIVMYETERLTSTKRKKKSRAVEICLRSVTYSYTRWHCVAPETDTRDPTLSATGYNVSQI